jgi:hypothetical protein
VMGREVREALRPTKNGAGRKTTDGQYSMTSHQWCASSWTRSTVSTMLSWCRVDEMQNSDVSFLTYSFSLSFLRRLRNSCHGQNNC